MRKTQSRHTDLVRRQGVEHECIVGVRTVGDGDFADAARRIFQLRNLGGRVANAHISTLRTRRQPVVMPAASITLIISAKTNQWNPKRRACAKEWVKTTSHEVPLANSRISASTPAVAARKNVPDPRSMIQPARAATNG